MVSNERTQASSWIWDEEDDTVLSLSRRVTYATGLLAHRDHMLSDNQPLHFEHAEPWQVASTNKYSCNCHYYQGWCIFSWWALSATS